MNFKSKLTVLLVLLTLLFSLSLTSCSAGSEVILTKDELYQNVSSETDESRPYVWEYLDAWRFPVFNQSKMKRIERLYRSYYYEEIPSSYEIAVEIANNFLENSYDDIDLQSSQKVSDALLNAFIKAIGDPYSRYRTNEQYDNYSTDMSGVFYGIGVNVIVGFVDDGILITDPVKYSPAEKAGVLAGDLIIKIDGVTVIETTYTDAVNMIKGKAGTEVVITVKRGEEILDIAIKRGAIVAPSVDYEIYDGIGYIVINSFKANTDEFFIEAVDYMKENNVKAIIYDVRDNGGGYLDTVVNMLDYIAKDGINLVSFSNNYGSPVKASDDHSLSIPSVVICNKNSASASELFTQGMRDLGESGSFPVTIVGQTTYGKFVMQNTYTMTDGSAVTLTVAYYYSPLGKQFNGVGITPDVDLTEGLTATEIRNLTDEFYIENAIIEANKLLENK